jgi:hypothetical protein
LRGSYLKEHIVIDARGQLRIQLGVLEGEVLKKQEICAVCECAIDSRPVAVALTVVLVGEGYEHTLTVVVAQLLIAGGGSHRRVKDGLVRGVQLPNGASHSRYLGGRYKALRFICDTGK